MKARGRGTAAPEPGDRADPPANAPETNAPRASTGGRPLHVFICAGEASGDEHGAALARSLRERDPGVRLTGLGGPAMKEAGVETPFDFVAHATMGLFPVLKKLPFFMRAFDETVARLAEDPPDVLVPIDYPGFNLRLSRAARKRAIPVCYYVSPQVWAWAQWRVKKIARSVDHMLVLFPFEKEFYDRHGVPCTFVGHPIFDRLRARKRTPAFRAEVVGAAPDEPVIGLLPGSRRTVVERNLPLELDVARRVLARAPDAKLVVPIANPALRGLIDSIVAEHGQGLPLRVLDGHARDVGRVARVVIVTSGTATVEMLWYEVPMVIVYAITRLESAFKKAMIKTPYVGLVNVLADREAVPEFVDHKDRREEMAERALALLRDGRERRRTVARLRALKEEIARPGASDRAAEAVLTLARARLAGGKKA